MNASKRITRTSSSLINLFSGRCGGYVKLEYISNITNYSVMNNIALSQKNSTNDQHPPFKIELDADDKNDSRVEKVYGTVSVKKENTEKLKPRKSVEHFPVRCVTWNCPAWFESSDAMIYHLNTYHERGIRKIFNCHLCEKTHTSLRTLQMHFTNIHSGPDRYPCSVATCSKSFVSKVIMRRHVNGVHTKQITYDCTKCSFKSHYKQHLKRHLTRVHDESGPHKCCWCKMTFDTKQMLQQHKESLHKSRRNKCKCPIETCSKYFIAYSVLQQHINAVHTKRVVFDCTKCSFKSYYKCSLVKHLAIKHREGCSTAASYLNCTWYLRTNNI